MHRIGLILALHRTGLVLAFIVILAILVTCQSPLRPMPWHGGEPQPSRLPRVAMGAGEGLAMADDVAFYVPIAGAVVSARQA
jgi:hypothetical protein